MNRNQRLLTLTIPIEVWSETGTDILLDTVPSSLMDSGYSEGRYPFSREMFANGLQEMLQQAVRDSVLQFMKLKHGNGSLDMGDGIQVSAAHHYTDAYIKKEAPHVVVEMDGWEVTTSKVTA